MAFSSLCSGFFTIESLDNAIHRTFLGKSRLQVPISAISKKLFKFICLGHREGISRNGAAFFKGADPK